MATGRGAPTGGTGILGTPRASGRPPNTSSIWRYLFVAFVVMLGAIYAAPNLFQPDSALQIKLVTSIGADDAGLSGVNQALIDRSVSLLRADGIQVVGSRARRATAPSSVCLTATTSSCVVRRSSAEALNSVGGATSTWCADKSIHNATVAAGSGRHAHVAGPRPFRWRALPCSRWTWTSSSATAWSPIRKPLRAICWWSERIRYAIQPVARWQHAAHSVSRTNRAGRRLRR